MKLDTAYRKLFKHRKRSDIEITFDSWNDWVTVSANPNHIPEAKKKVGDR